MTTLIRLATRKSNMALHQANYVARLLHQYFPELELAFVECSTKGDEIQDRPLSEVGGKALFVKSLERKLFAGEADIAVHCLKDVPSFLHDELFELNCFLTRGSPFDALIAPDYQDLADLPKGACVGTSSPRRQAMLLHQRSDLTVEMLRGNVETRLRKLSEGLYDAIILAECGLQRLGLTEHITQVLSPEQFLPAVGQGIICIEIMKDRDDLRQLLAQLDHWPTRQCALAERALCQTLNGDCHSPIGSYATLTGKVITLQGAVGSLDGETLITHQASGHDPLALGQEVGRALLAKGADKLL
jgi:hydroxymethylbilane synthase